MRYAARVDILGWVDIIACHRLTKVDAVGEVWL